LREKSAIHRDYDDAIGTSSERSNDAIGHGARRDPRIGDSRA
jgi:hypothetical protein